MKASARQRSNKNGGNNNSVQRTLARPNLKTNHDFFLDFKKKTRAVCASVYYSKVFLKVTEGAYFAESVYVYESGGLRPIKNDIRNDFLIKPFRYDYSERK